MTIPCRVIGDATPIDFEATDYAVVGIDKTEASQRVAFTGSFSDCSDYAERNDSPDNYERYQVRRDS